MNIMAFVVESASTNAPKCSMLAAGGFAIGSVSFGLGLIVQEPANGR